MQGERTLHCINCKKNIQEALDNHRPFCPECSFPIQMLAGQFRLESVIAEGGFGVVYKAIDTKAQYKPERAIKILKPSLFSQAGIFERFEREINVTSAFSKETPHIVHVYPGGGFDQAMGYFYVMEHLEGQSLRDLMEQGPVPQGIVRSIFKQICRVLQLIHKKNIAHRDLKPENIFLVRHETNEYFVKLLDFGIVKVLGNDHEKLTQGTLGSPDYMAPEQCIEGDLDERIDQYSLATLLYEMLTGFHPLFQEDENLELLHKLNRLLRRKPDSMHERRPTLSRQLDAVVLRALSKDSKERYSSIEEFEQAVLEHLKTTRSAQPARKANMSVDYHVPIEVTDSSYWVGLRPNNAIFFANPYLRVFKGVNKHGRETVFNLLIDPGSSHDIGTVRAKVASIIGGLDKISAVFINHQDPDVCSGTTLLLGRYAPQAKIICSEDTWRLIQHFNLPRERYISTDKYPRGFKIATQHTLVPVPSPFCHFAGAVMLYDPQTRTLYSGDLFGGLTDRGAAGMWADGSDWTGMRAFHQIYMPSNAGLRYAVNAIRQLNPPVEIIAPQHGRWLRGEWVDFYMDKLANLPVGLDILEEESHELNQTWTQVLTRVIRTAEQFMGEDAVQRLQNAGELKDAIKWNGNQAQVQRSGKWVVERSVIYLSIGLPDLSANMIVFEAVGAAEELQLPTPNVQLNEGENPMNTFGVSGNATFNM